jgi:protein-tyrosine phosphatase
LKEGQLVVVPTETVYGIAVNLHAAPARAAALHMKHPPVEGQPPVPAGPWVVHVASAEQALAWVPNVSKLGRRLLTKALPGPVAFQVRLDAAAEQAARERLGDAADETIQDGFITLRCPELGATQDVLAAVAAPVAIIGAGTPSQPAVFEVGDLPATLMGEGAGPIAAVLDGGPTRYRRSSTLVRIDGESYSVVRPGVIDERIIHKMADFTVLFLCSGNTCRSPMASAIAGRLLADQVGVQPEDLPLRHIVVQSAGLHAGRGMRATLEAVDAVKGLGADLSAHFSQPATPELLRRADVIYTMTNAHREEVLHLVPSAERKTFLLDPDGDVADPIGASLSVYEKVASRLKTVLQQRISELPV